MKRLKNNKGVAILTVLFVLVIVTLLATGAIMLATVQVKVSGTVAQMESARSTAEGAVNYVIPLIQSIHYEGQIPAAYSTLVSTATTTIWPGLLAELTLPAQMNHVDKVEDASPNIKWDNLGGFVVALDIDTIGAALMPGGSVEASWGYHKGGESPLVSGYRIAARATTPGGRYTSNMCQVIWLKSLL